MFFPHGVIFVCKAYLQFLLVVEWKVRDVDGQDCQGSVDAGLWFVGCVKFWKSLFVLCPCDGFLKNKIFLGLGFDFDMAGSTLSVYFDSEVAGMRADQLCGGVW